MAGFGSLAAALDTLESAVAGKAFVAGERFSAADGYVGSQIDWGLQFGTIAPRPAFEAYAAGLRERAAYKRAKDIDNGTRSEENTSELQSIMRTSSAVFCRKKTQLRDLER